jgi:hypothetical protein
MATDDEINETRAIMLRVRMLPSLKAKLERLAKAQHRSMSNYLEALIREQPEPPPPPKGKRK